MSDFPNQDDLFRICRDEVLAKQALLSLEAVERAGSDANVLLAAASAAGDEVVGQLSELCAALFLGSAQGQKLDKLVFDRYSLVRKPAAPARATVTFTLAAPNPSTFVIPAGTLLSTADGTQFITTQTATILVNETSASAPARSILAGSKQQAKVGAISSIMSTVAGSPGGMTVNNALATSGAADAEQDGDLRDRARRFWSTARRGTLSAIEQAALAVPGVRRATAIEVTDTSGRPARLVQLIVADSFTDALVVQNTTTAAYQQQSQQLAQQVFSSLLDTRAAGIFVQVLVGEVILQPIKLQLRFQAGVDADLVALVARATIVAKVNSLAPGQTMLVSDLYAELRKVSGLSFGGDEVSSPLADIVPRALQVLRTSLNLVTAAPASTEAPNALLSTFNPDLFVV